MGTTSGIGPQSTPMQFGLLIQPPAGQPPAQEQAKIDGLIAKYSGICECALCVTGKPTSADAVLNQIKAQQYSDIMAHEMAHKSAAGAYGGGIVINYDSSGVAVAGHVPISIPGLNPADPDAGLKAYQTIYKAALAPGDPSGADKAIASTAMGLMGKAQVLMAQKRQQQTQAAGIAGIGGQSQPPQFGAAKQFKEATPDASQPGNPPGRSAGSPQPAMRPGLWYQA